MARIHNNLLLLLLASLFASLTAAASAPTFCKCTCFSNSTIIPLGPHKDAPPSPQPPASTPSTPSNKTPDSSGGSNPGDGSDAQQSSISQPRSQTAPDDIFGGGGGGLEKRASSSSCAQCNRAFCLKYNLPICRGAEEKDVMTSCFQRDSRKDQIIVWGFILGTCGLLGWAGIKRILEAREDNKGLPILGALGGGSRTVGAGGSGGASRMAGSGLLRRVTSAGAGTSDAADRGRYSPLGDSTGGGAGRGPP
ncbi:hypothetical protein QBC46DRAFT_406192 [Diplogelasinospora grovesii]|uniref:Uncharacterized protein n=1 Tax=Diplogelasinospora grovesii TaxID=303347 RepID=A0AAN6S7A3_9PEZI|nr:hypothetical protein QBC46DRAFT_406192 [Diplogelasinospora grovesii]